MFTELAALITGTQVLDITIGAVGADGRMKIIIKPQLEKGATTALAQPLALVATPEELDAEFATVLAQYSGDRLSLQKQIEVTKTILEQYKTAEVGKASKAYNTATPKSDQHNDTNDEDGDSDHLGGNILDNSQSTKGKLQPTSADSKISSAWTSSSENDDLLSLLQSEN